MKYRILDDIGNHFLDRVVELVKSGHKFVYVLDNIDWEEKTHDMRQDAQNRSVHAVSTSIVFNRVPCHDLPDLRPQQDLGKCDVSQLVMVNKDELAAICKRYGVLIAKLLFENCPEFKVFEQYMTAVADSSYVHEMSTKSEVFTMPVLMKDEKKYADCVGVLDQLEKWTQEIYEAAGLCGAQPEPSTTSPPPIGAHSRPDQPASHVAPSPSPADPLQGVKIPCFGDQLTRVRLAGAKDLRAGCHLAKQRLDHLYPFCIVDWHTKRSYLKV